MVQDEIFLLTESRAIPLPLPGALRNPASNCIVSLSEVVRWLGAKAEEAGVEIYPGFAGAELVYEKEKVVGVATNDVGLNRQGQPKVKRRRSIHVVVYHVLCRRTLKEDWS